MAKDKTRIFKLEGDEVRVPLIYNEELGQYLYDYPNFREKPRLTSGGKMWVNVTTEDCLFADNEYKDCGSCKFFRCEHPGDLIGICDNPMLIRQGKEE